LIGTALESFRNVVGNGNGRPLDLITEAALSSELGLPRESINLDPQLDARLPDGELLETLILHLRLLNLESVIAQCSTPQGFRIYAAETEGSQV
jgi:hypothetical protein